MLLLFFIPGIGFVVVDLVRLVIRCFFFALNNVSVVHYITSAFSFLFIFLLKQI